MFVFEFFVVYCHFKLPRQFINPMSSFSIKEARYPGGYLYETDISLAFVGDFETREWKELNRIRKILYQIEQIQKEEERVKKLRAETKDNEVEKTDEVTCYKFPIYSPVPQVKVPIFQADY